jgi:hypothetical protein
MDPEIPSPRQMAEEAVELLRGWRAEAAKQWTDMPVEADPEALRTVLQSGEAFGVKLLASLCVVLKCEWLYRARRATADDIEGELWGIRNGLSKSLRGALTPDQAALVVEALRAGITKRLQSRRYLVSLRTWAVPAHGLPFRGGGTKCRPENATDFPVDVVKTKRGRVPKVGPMVASVLYAGLLERAGAAPSKADRLGADLGSVLLSRTVLLPEFRGWKAALDRPVPDPAHPEEQTTLRSWLVSRAAGGPSFLERDRGWQMLRDLAAREPQTVFVGRRDAQVAARLYAITWSEKNPSKKGSSSRRGKSQQLPGINPGNDAVP